jgi:glycosyltransferase involved in cell wall biosynthesis
MSKVAACLIAGDSWEEKDIKRLLGSLQGVANGIFVSYNGSKSKLKWQKWTDIPLHQSKLAWEDDFAKARNHSFSLVPRDEYDWYLWLDTDDEFVAEKPVQEVLDSLDPYTQGVYLRYDYSIDPITNQVVVQQWRERILSTKVDWKWVYPVHEVARGPLGTVLGQREHLFVKHHRDTSESNGTRERNRRIIARALRETPDDPRMLFYFANEIMAEADNAPDGPIKDQYADSAITSFKKFLATQTEATDDAYLALTRIGELHLMKGKPGEAIDAFVEAIKFYPHWPDGYIGAARACMDTADWKRCEEFASLALKVEAPSTFAAATPLTARYTPHLVRGIAREEQGRVDEAKEDYLRAKEIWDPPNGVLRERITALEGRVAVQSKDRDDRKRLRGTRPDRSIAFVTAPLPEPWHPELEKQSGAGGAETCIMRLAPRFAADGWRAVVFGTPGQEQRGIDEHGVEWWNSHEFLPNEEFSVLIVSRAPEFFEANLAARKKIYWAHDVNVGERFIPFKDRPDKVVGLTNWHARHLHKLYGVSLDRLAVIPNGIESSLYDWSQRNDEGSNLRFIWSSSPDRGLGVLIGLWPEIRKRYPTATLDVFYGWNIIDKVIAMGGPRADGLASFKEEIFGNVALLGGEESGIRMRGRVPQAELAKWQLSAHIWPYPTDFMETFCITAIEMQAAGVIPITSKLAALTETVFNMESFVEGWPRNLSYQRQWLDKLDEVVERPREQTEELQLVARQRALEYDWDRVYANWCDML